MREEREGERHTHVRGRINTRVIWREKMKRPGREDVICDFFGGKLNDRRNDRRDFSPREREREREGGFSGYWTGGFARCLMPLVYACVE